MCVKKECERVQVCGRTGGRASNATLPFTRGHGAVRDRGPLLPDKTGKDRWLDVPGAGGVNHKPTRCFDCCSFNNGHPSKRTAVTWMRREEIESNCSVAALPYAMGHVQTQCRV